MAVGVDALFVETHEDPEKALSDGPNALPLEQLESFITRLLRIREAVGLPA
jgi:2-dehydro-3-deoxyphosphooctonate aldolase (KDO 8-P synthase)